jgi:hypothetical protein
VVPFNHGHDFNLGHGTAAGKSIVSLPIQGHFFVSGLGVGPPHEGPTTTLLFEPVICMLEPLIQL